jgi:ribosomal protein S18 acetylase RimI-like enzyme
VEFSILGEMVKMMKYTSRSYQSNQDLFETGRLLRCAYSSSKYLNACSVCRFDIWAQRRLDETASFAETDWQKQFRFWFDESGELAGATFAYENHHRHKNPDPFAIVLHPEHIRLAEPMLEWAETQASPEVEIVESNLHLLELVQARGYTRSADFMSMREKKLAGSDPEPVNLPVGYRIEVLDQSRWNAYFMALNDVFNMMDTTQAYHSLQQAPSNVHDLHLLVLSEKDKIAAFCSVWLDRENHVAEFEPVGTVPGFQKKGLGSAILASACNRLREMDCPLVKVESWSESFGANRLYSSNLLEEVGRFHSWKKAG